MMKLEKFLLFVKDINSDEIGFDSYHSSDKSLDESIKWLNANIQSHHKLQIVDLKRRIRANIIIDCDVDYSDIQKYYIKKEDLIWLDF